MIQTANVSVEKTTTMLRQTLEPVLISGWKRHFLLRKYELTRVGLSPATDANPGSVKGVGNAYRFLTELGTAKGSATMITTTRVARLSVVLSACALVCSLLALAIAVRPDDARWVAARVAAWSPSAPPAGRIVESTPGRKNRWQRELEGEIAEIRKRAGEAK